jgi:hypothetical protein
MPGLVWGPWRLGNWRELAKARLADTMAFVRPENKQQKLDGGTICFGYAISIIDKGGQKIETSNNSDFRRKISTL